MKKLSFLLPVMLAAAILLIPNVAATPMIWGYATGPNRAAFGQVFTIKVTFTNYGSTPARYTSIRLVVPRGLAVAWGQNPICIGTVYPRQSRTAYFQVRAPYFSTNGNVYAWATYSSGYCTSQSHQLYGYSIKVERGFRIRCVLYSNKDLTGGNVVLYNGGQFVTSRYTSTFGSSTLVVDLYVLDPGRYTSSALVYCVNGQNGLGRKTFGVYSDTVQWVYCPTWTPW